MSEKAISEKAIFEASKQGLSAAVWVTMLVTVACAGEDPTAPVPSPAIPAAMPEPTRSEATRVDGNAAGSPPPAAVGPSWYGVVVARSSVDVAASTAGLLERVLVRPGDPVVAGQVVARVDSRLLRQDLLRGEAALTGAEADLHRAATTAGQAAARHSRRASMADAISREEAAAAATEAEIAAAEEQAAIARVAERRADLERIRQEVSSTTIRAPFDAVVALRLLDPGASVAAGSPVVRLVSSQERWVRFAVPLEELPELVVGSLLEVGIEPAVQARIVHIAPEVDSAANMVFVDAVFVDAVFANDALPAGMRTGLGVRVRRLTKG